MAYKRTSPQPVVEGGTGAQTFTSHGVLLGNTTGAITATAAGATGQVLTGITGNAPTFQSLPASSISITGDSGGTLTGNSFTFTGASTGLTFAGSGSTETLGGTLVITNGGTNATSFTQSNGIITYNGTRLVNYAGPQISSSGIYTNSTQPAFLAYQGTSGTDVTGDGTTYTLAIDTKIFDQDSNFNTSTFTFTAPVSGRYAFQAVVRLQQLAVGMNMGILTFITSNRGYETDRANYGVIFEANTGNATYDAKGSLLADMDAADTCFIQIQVLGGSKVVDVVASSATVTRTWFSGYLVA